jgi:hypothetical protein
MLCPKCGLESSTDKVCSNCWADLIGRARALNKREPSKTDPMSKVWLWVTVLVVMGFLITLMADLLIPDQARPPKTDPPVENLPTP